MRYEIRDVRYEHLWWGRKASPVRFVMGVCDAVCVGERTAVVGRCEDGL